MRKVFRMIDEYAKALGLDPLAHQALLQVYGSPNQALRVSALAERLDIATPFASNLVTNLVNARLLKRGSDASDMRVTIVRLTDMGRELCHQIDSGARSHVDALIEKLYPEEREFALASLTFYVGGKGRQLMPQIARDI
jgi:DNA-binding MarR family transcriptional regulator